MTKAQAAIFNEGPRHHYALELKLKDGRGAGQLIAALKTGLPKDRAIATIGFGPAAWKALSAGNCPSDLVDFQAIETDLTCRAPASQGDLWLWFQGDDPSAVFDNALQARNALADCCDILLSQPGFIYRDSMDLMGFEDGSANPKEEARFDAALVPEGRPGAGGAIVFTQKWRHDLTKFNAVPVPEQEGIIGRTKIENIELEGDDMPEDSHVSRTDVKIEGVAQKIFRRSFPYGTTEENGLYFLCFACETRRVQVQLDRMFGVSGDGIYDRITEFSVPVSGAYWFAPSNADLDRLLQ